jgi:2-succinyl-5-enolpyruvyl-6-hydroxy-3-cyclohexene-1-carboxylate synthase
VAGLVAGGADRAVICPGSRSTPLALGLLRHPRMRVRMHYDERSAAYFALGWARARRRPVVVLATSGTAVANFLAAVVEAHYSHVPLVLLTADRPPELWDAGAAQTIHQVGIFGPHVKWAASLPTPADHDALARHAVLVGRRAAEMARAGPAGPVHLNVPLREPLVPVFRGDAGPAVHPPEVFGGPPPAAVPAGLAERLEDAGPGILVAGASDLADAWPALQALSAALGWPILADPLSNLRTVADPDSRIISRYDLVLRGPARTVLTPAVAVRFGAPPTSKVLNTWLESIPTWVVDPDGGFRDPTLGAAAFWTGGPPAAATAVAVRDGRWLARWQAAERLADDALRTALGEIGAAAPEFEGLWYPRLQAPWARGLAVMVGNSMPVRDLDSFFGRAAGGPRFWGNRGAMGIDGVLSTGLGLAAEGQRVLVILGDLSFFHDQNGLLAARLGRLDATVVVVHNDGGGIFSFLPQHALDPGTFETLFGTPHGLDFEGTARTYGLPFRRVTHVDELEAAVRATLGEPGTHLVEWRVLPREDNVRRHDEVAQAVARSVTAEAVADAVV